MSLANLSEEERIARRINPELHIVTPNYRKSGWLDSFGNLFKIAGTSHFLHQTTRPPFPILMDKVTVTDVFHEMNKSDLLLFGTFYFSGIVFSYFAARKVSPIDYRMILFQTCSFCFTLTGAGLAFLHPWQRLIGVKDNGLRWRRPDRMKKYDFTSELFEHKIYKHFKVKTD